MTVGTTTRPPTAVTRLPDRAAPAAASPPAAAPAAGGRAVAAPRRVALPAFATHGTPGADTLPAAARDALLDAPRPRTRGPVLFGLAAILLFFGGFGAWSALAPLSEAAVAPGVIKVEGQRRTIQHMEGGYIREILARDGDRVERGQVLMRLDDIQSGANLETLRSQRWALLAQDARLSSEFARLREIAFPQELLAAEDPRARDAVAGQRALFEARQASLASQIGVLEARIEQQLAARESAEGTLRSAQQQLASFRQEEADIGPLVRQGLIQRPRLLQIQRSATEQEARIVAAQADIERANHAIAEARGQIRQVVDQRLQEVSTELHEVRTRLAEVEERLRAAQDVAQRRDIVAPEPGIVVNSRFFTVGAVVRPGEAVMDLTPLQDRLIAEVMVQPHDIDVVYPGLRTEVRLPAFKQRLVPYLHGHVTYVASDVTMDERTRQSYFRAFVLIDQDQLAHLPNVHLVPGMPVEAYIQVGERSFFRYMIQPILDSFHRAFREQ
ncbi:HlyD family type I secretion periplasmic adaptor subunit [Caldovatus aquaticus]|uniref:Membrane fusion protein (MFP) family protein n=1 Tax=Caldovatus aquaticus TaxID=2865671 RepID=A0ABS7EZ30_9PROT|nr:HlyD family type I secretion periplasmic adaptor subunit [Caldovatus aquaticus]MBW8268544.1 HlyD family type I secretion periplasmic adaptor subunit [Caldovatus aquaticus]